MAQIPFRKQPKNIPSKSKWLNGEGAGTWLLVEPENQSKEVFRIKRYDEAGTPEFDLLFHLDTGELDFQKEYHFDYPSHALKCTIQQAGSKLNFKRFYS